MAETDGEGGPTGGATTRKFMDTPMTPSQTAGSETDLVKLVYDKPVTLTDLQKEWFRRLPKVDETPLEDWQKVFVDLYEVARGEDASIKLQALDSQINWEKWLGTPIKNPIQSFDK